MRIESPLDTPIIEDSSNNNDDPSMKKMAAGAGVSLFGTILARGLDFFKQVAMARFLGAQLFGLYALGWNTLRLVGILATAGLHTGVMHFATAYHHKNNGAFKSVIIRSILISFAIGWAITLVLILIAPWLTTTLFNSPEFLNPFRVFALMLPFLGALRVAATATRISQRMQYAILAEDIIQSTVNLILFTIFYLVGWRLLGAIISTVIAYIAALVLAIYFLYKLFGEEFRNSSHQLVSDRTLLTYSMPTAFAEFSGALITRVDRIFLGYFRTSAEVGVYQAAAQLSVIMASVLYAFNMILMPMISEQFHKKDMRQLEELFRVNTKWGIYSVVPLVLIIGFASEDIMVVLFGAEYLAGATALLILTVGQFINIATGATATILIMTGNQTRWFRLSMIMMFINLALNLLLIPKWGLNGAALVTSITISAQFIVGLIMIYRILHIWPYDRRYIKGIMSALIVCGALFIVGTIDLSPLINLLVTTIISIVGFYGLLLIFGLDPEDKTFISQIAERFLRTRREEESSH